jgi:methionine aminopeptidase
VWRIFLPLRKLLFNYHMYWYNMSDMIFCWSLSSDPLSSQTLAKDDVVKLHLGAQIDGFAAISAETIVVGASEENPVTGRRADVLKAAWSAAEVAMRLVKVGGKNWAITDAVNKVTAAWDCKAVEGESESFAPIVGLTLGPRYAVVPARPKCDWWQKEDRIESIRGSETWIRHSDICGRGVLRYWYPGRF